MKRVIWQSVRVACLVLFAVVAAGCTGSINLGWK